MNRAITEHIQAIGDENSYTSEFFKDLYTKLEIKDRAIQFGLEKIIIIAAQKYMRRYSEYNRELSQHEVKKELKKSLNHIDKAALSFIKVIESGNYGEDIANHLHDSISQNHPRLKGALEHIRETNQFGTKTSPSIGIELLESVADSIERTLKSGTFKKTTPKSIALYEWLMIVSVKLEQVMERKLEQSKYNQGEFISNKEENDSDLLLSIIHPLDPNVTASQMETALKETHKERHENPRTEFLVF